MPPGHSPPRRKDAACKRARKQQRMIYATDMDSYAQGGLDVMAGIQNGSIPEWMDESRTDGVPGWLESIRDI